VGREDKLSGGGNSRLGDKMQKKMDILLKGGGGNSRLGDNMQKKREIFNDFSFFQ